MYPLEIKDKLKPDTNPKTEQNETIEQGKSSNAARGPVEAKSTKEKENLALAQMTQLVILLKYLQIS